LVTHILHTDTEYPLGLTDLTIPDLYHSYSLLVPEKVTRNGVEYRFLQWIVDGVGQLEFQNWTRGIYIKEGGSTAVAVYDVFLSSLSVYVPACAHIEGDKPGTGPYGVAFTSAETVTLIAPPNIICWEAYFSFTHWTIDDVAQPEGDLAVTVTMTSDHVLQAKYEKPPQATITSTPVTGIEIGGDRPGTTEYIAVLSPTETLDLVAPETAEVGGALYRFAHWKVWYQLWTDPILGISKKNDGHIITAVYSQLDPKLTVGSVPFTGVHLTGTKPGTTPYTATCTYMQPVALSAPPTIMKDGKTWTFAWWEFRDKRDRSRQNPLQLTLREDRQVDAWYTTSRIRLAGPADRGEPPLPYGGGTFAVDIYVADVELFQGMEVMLAFNGGDGLDAAFRIAIGPGDPQFGGYAIEFDSANWPDVLASVTVGGRHFWFVPRTGAPLVGEQRPFRVTCQYGPRAEGTFSIRTVDDSSMLASNGLEAGYVETFGTVVIGLAADMNNDCIVNELDLLALRDLLGQRGSPGMRGDLNGDGVINILDLVILRSRMGKTCQ